MSITQAIRDKRLKTLQSSENFAKHMEKRTNLAAQTLKVARLNNELNGDTISSADLLKRQYYKMYEEYYNKTLFSYDDGEENEKSKKLWERVAKRCEESGADEITFMKAQFAWFHTSFKKAPTLSQLTTEAAVSRARVAGGATVTGKIVSGGIEANIDFATIMKQSEIAMQKLMKAQNMTREQVYTEMVIPGLYSFPKEFLKADPAYKRALEGQ